MTEFDKDTLVSPTYRYYTVDLLTNKVLAEIPFGGVSYERAVKAAGAFSGKVPVLATESNRSWDLYKSTMPGKTGLYVLRDGQCVWGGIIWSRTYELTSKDLTVNASEFTSYFQHRRIWKTWTHSYGATVTSDNGQVDVVMQTGSTVATVPGSSVFLEFYDPIDFRFNGYYIIADSPEPTDLTFSIDGSYATAKINSFEVNSNVVTIYTDGAHGFTTDDTITITMDDGSYSYLNGSFPIAADAGSKASYFTYNLNHADVARTTAVGAGTRPLPDGNWANVTVTVRSDTYAYIRSLVQNVFNDFTGIDFADQELTPGESYSIPIKSKSLANGFATITTQTDHGIIPGQSVKLQNMGKQFNGDQEVIDTPHTDTFRFRSSGSLGTTTVKPTTHTIIGRQAGDYIATMFTDVAHGFTEGDMVTVYSGSDADSAGYALNGTWQIIEVPSPTEFRYNINSDFSVDKTDLVRSTARVGSGAYHNIIRRKLSGNVATITTADVNNFSVGNIVSISNLNLITPIVQKALDATRDIATITTQGTHSLSTGDSVTISGLSDTATIVQREGTNAKLTFTTKSSHNFKVGQTVTFTNMTDKYTPLTRAVSNNIATLTMKEDVNTKVGDMITVSNIQETNSVIGASIGNGIATVYTSTSQALALSVNDRVTISGIVDNATVITKSTANGDVLLITRKPHNYKVGQTITVSGVGKPFDGSFKVTAVTDTHVHYKIAGSKKTETVKVKEKGKTVSKKVTKTTYPNVKSSSSRGSIRSTSKVLNGTFTVATVDAANWRFTFTTTANDMNKADYNGADVGKATFSSPVNGQFTVTATTRNSVSYACITIGRSQSNIAYPASSKSPQPGVTQRSILSGSHTITAVTGNTFSYNPSNNIVLYSIPKQSSNGTASVPSLFNGTRTVTGTTATTFSFTLPATVSISETAANSGAYVRAGGMFNGNHTITSVDPKTNSFSFSSTHGSIASASVSGYGTATITPQLVTGTYGPYPGNSDIDIEFEHQDYSSSNVQPTDIRGYQLTNVGDMLNSYSDSVEGFEYRIDCSFDIETNTFRRTFVFIPINFPDPPTPGEVSPVARFGADQLVFEYPGSITNVSIAESAENSSTRFFAVGQNPEGMSSDAALPFASASSVDLLSGGEGERWPMLDDDTTVQNIYEKDTLYTYATRYLTEGRPPGVSLTVNVNGSIQPEVGTYNPGDWCSLVIDDEFIRQRLASDMEPRDTVLVRKIDSFKVTVPDGSTAPEQVDLTLVTEWAVDNNGKQ